MYQSIAVPLDLKANRGLTIYLVALHASMLVLLLAAGVLWLAVLMRKIWARAHGRRYRLGLAQGFKNSLVTLTIATMATFVLFCAAWRCDHGCGQTGMGQCPSGESGRDVLELAGDPDRVRRRGVGMVPRVHAADRRGNPSSIAQWPPRKGAIGEIVSGRSRCWLPRGSDA